MANLDPRVLHLTLQDILEEKDRRIWQDFVDVVSTWTQRIISVDEVEKAMS